MKKTAFILCCCLLALPAVTAAETTTITEDKDRIVVEITGSPAENRPSDPGAPSPSGGSNATPADTSYIQYDLDGLQAEMEQIRQQGYEGEPAEEKQRRRVRMSEIANQMKELQMRRLSTGH
jgi:hypothetical protein